MKAIINDTYGSPDLLRLEEIETPVPEAGEVLVKIQASSANAGDWHLIRGTPFLIRLMFGLFKPKNKIPGADIAGRVEALGPDVTRFQVGDEVFGDISECGFGAFAEYACVPEKFLANKPADLSFEEAAAIPSAAITALQGLRDSGEIQAGQRVLITGASGGVGSFAVQIAKSFGAEVTAVCSTRNRELVSALGADHVIDYTREDFAANGKRYDLIIDAAAFRSIHDNKRVLSPTGKYVMIGGSTGRFFEALLLGPLLSLSGKKKIGTMMVKPNAEDLARMVDLMAAGKLKPVIDRRYSLREVPEAIRYMEAGHTRGKVVINHLN